MGQSCSSDRPEATPLEEYLRGYRKWTVPALVEEDQRAYQQAQIDLMLDRDTPAAGIVRRQMLRRQLAEGRRGSMAHHPLGGSVVIGCLKSPENSFSGIAPRQRQRVSFRNTAKQ